MSPSQIFAVASILENCSYINGSPQNTFVPGIIELAEQHPGVFIVGDDFKSGIVILRISIHHVLVLCVHGPNMLFAMRMCVYFRANEVEVCLG